MSFPHLFYVAAMIIVSATGHQGVAVKCGGGFESPGCDGNPIGGHASSASWGHRSMIIAGWDSCVAIHLQVTHCVMFVTNFVNLHLSLLFRRERRDK